MVLNQTDDTCLFLTIRDVSGKPMIEFTAIATSIVGLLSSLGSIFGNALILYVIVKFDRLQNPSNILLGNLCLTDFITGLVVVPTISIRRIMEAYGKGICAIRIICAYFAYLTVIVSIITVGMISADRYFAIMRPFQYQRTITNSRYIAFISVLWVILGVYSGLPFLRVLSGTTYFKIAFMLMSVTIVVFLICYLQIAQVALAQRRKLHAFSRNGDTILRDTIAQGASRDITTIVLNDGNAVLSDDPQVPEFQVGSLTRAPKQKETNDDATLSKDVVGAYVKSEIQESLRKNCTQSDIKAISYKETSNITSFKHLPNKDLMTQDFYHGTSEPGIEEKPVLMNKNNTVKDCVRRSEGLTNMEIVSDLNPVSISDKPVKGRQGSNDDDIRQETSDSVSSKRYNINKGEQKRANTIAILVFVAVLCYGPLAVIYILRAIHGDTYELVYLADPWADLILYINSTINPMIYCLRGKEFRVAVKKVLPQCVLNLCVRD